MLGRLARWLRILGHDVLYFRRIEDGELVAVAERERRILLTRDRRLVQRRDARNSLLIESPLIEHQLRQMHRWNPDALLAPGLCRRCLECNVPTRSVPREALRHRVPPYVHRTQRRFLECPSCRRVYWRATHVRDMIRRLKHSLAPAESRGRARSPGGSGRS